MLARIKTGEAASRRDLRMQLALERITGVPQEDSYVSKEMQRGIDLEPIALGEYEAITGTLVQQCGFVSMVGVMAGCSLDGYVGDFDGIVELKCPKSATHLEYIRSRTIPSEYHGQLTHNMWVTDAKWAEFVSYDDRFPEHLRLYRCRVTREEMRVSEYEQAALRFLAEVVVDVKEIESLKLAA